MIVGYVITRGVIKRFRAHGMDKRYALYLSTLSYQLIRKHRIKDLSQATDKDFELAAADLDKHLRFVRGGEPAKSAYANLKGYPVRVLTKKVAEKYTQETTLDPSDKTTLAPAYAAYIW